MKWKKSLVLILLTILFIDCGRKAIIRKYYILEVEDTATLSEMALEKSYPYNLNIRDFQVAKAFDQTRIALRSESHEVNYYFYHHWAVRPAIAIPDMIYHIIDNTGLFRRCSRDYMTNADFILTGTVHKIERIERKKFEAAALNLSFELIEAKSNVRVLRYEFNRELELVNDRSMNGFAKALSQILLEETEILIRKIKDYFESIETAS